VREPLSDFELACTPLLAVFELWEGLAFPPNALLWFADSMRITPGFLIEQNEKPGRVAQASACVVLIFMGAEQHTG
jgi:hypothetical protein